MQQITHTTLLAAMLCVVQHSHATVTVTHDFGAWSAAAGQVTILDFTGFAPDTFITTQYQSLGAVFTDTGSSTDYILGPSITTFPLDGWGLNGQLNDEIHISFATPQYSLGTHFAGIVQYELYDAGDVIYESPWFFSSPDPGAFAGVLSTRAFDRVVIRDPFSPVVVVDNIYFASGIPAPGGLAVLTCASLFSRRKRRS